NRGAGAGHGAPVCAGVSVGRAPTDVRPGPGRVPGWEFGSRATDPIGGGTKHGDVRGTEVLTAGRVEDVVGRGAGRGVGRGGGGGRRRGIGRVGRRQGGVERGRRG